MDDLIRRLAAIDALNKMKIYRPLDSDRYVISDCLNKIVNLPSAQTADAVEVIRCKDCKHFELNHFEKIDGQPIIVAHEICSKWGNGCKTDRNGYCFLGERKTDG